MLFAHQDRIDLHTLRTTARPLRTAQFHPCGSNRHRRGSRRTRLIALAVLGLVRRTFPHFHLHRPQDPRRSHFLHQMGKAFGSTFCQVAILARADDPLGLLARLPGSFQKELIHVGFAIRDHHHGRLRDLLRDLAANPIHFQPTVALLLFDRACSLPFLFGRRIEEFGLLRGSKLFRISRPDIRVDHSQRYSLRRDGQQGVNVQSPTGFVVQWAGTHHPFLGTREIQLRRVLNQQHHVMLRDALQRGLAMRGQNVFRIHASVPKEAVGPVCCRPTTTSGRNAGRGSLAQGIHHDPKTRGHPSVTKTRRLQFLFYPCLHGVTPLTNSNARPPHPCGNPIAKSNTFPAMHQVRFDFHQAIQSHPPPVCAFRVLAQPPCLL
jgi:hypothetical protein